ncbi:MAG: transporter substrate-binding domain-containing protein [Vogesella sp.]|jgi:ABC-type amino acid transport substrate-binding protein|uniref:substrate-binding periplasmic protein n=1 Tax=Vogesella sp. TaxID=1904252 RepID=UPI0011C702C4
MLIRLLTLLLFCAPPAQAQAVLQAYSVLYPPLHMGNAAGQKPGVADEMVQRAASLAGMKAEISTLPWRRAQLMASQQRNACVFPLSRLPAREKQYQWVGLILPGQVRLYGWAGNARLASPQAAADARITVLAGSSAEIRLQQLRLPYSTTNVVNDGLRLLQLGQADYWAVHDVVARYEARLVGFPLKAVATLGEADSWLACHRDYPTAQRQALQQAFSRLNAQGEAGQILQNYLGHDAQGTE